MMNYELGINDEILLMPFKKNGLLMRHL